MRLPAQDHPAGAVDLETTSLEPLRADIVGLSFATEPHTAWYVPVGHRYLGAPAQLPLAEVLAALGPVLTDPALPKYGQNIKYDALVLARAGIDLHPIGFDTMVASYVINPTRHQHNLGELALEYLNERVTSYAEVAGSGKKQVSFAEVEVGKARDYSGEDADVAFRLTRLLAPKIEQLALHELFYGLGLPPGSVLARMERNRRARLSGTSYPTATTKRYMVWSDAYLSSSIPWNRRPLTTSCAKLIPSSARDHTISHHETHFFPRFQGAPRELRLACSYSRLSASRRGSLHGKGLGFSRGTRIAEVSMDRFPRHRVIMKAYYLSLEEASIRKSIYPLSGTVTIGRGTGNTITIAHPTVSRSHAKIEHNDGTWSIEDTGSANGIFVDHNRVKNAVLESGNTYHIGKIALRLIEKEDSTRSQHFLETAEILPTAFDDLALLAEKERATPWSKRLLRDIEMVPFLAPISKAQLSKLANAATLHIFEEGQTIFSEGDPGRSIYAVVQGRVRIFIRDHCGRALDLATLEVGDFWGEISFLSGRPRSANATTLVSCLLIEVGYVSLKSLIQEQPGVKKILLEYYRNRSTKPRRFRSTSTASAQRWDCSASPTRRRTADSVPTCALTRR